MNPSTALVRLNFLVARFQFDCAPKPSCSVGVIAVVVAGVDESAFDGGLWASNGRPGIGVRSSEADEEAVGVMRACKELGRGLE